MIKSKRFDIKAFISTIITFIASIITFIATILLPIIRELSK
jgi:hypothetical protein